MSIVSGPLAKADQSRPSVELGGGLTYVSRIVELFLPHPRLTRARRSIPEAPSRIIVFSKMPNPTFDYYFQARLTAPGAPPYQVIDINQVSASELDATGAFVIICRYATSGILKWINANHASLAGVGLFVDDDIAAVVTGSEATLAYRFRLVTLALLPLLVLNRHLDVIWVSTDRLAARLGSDQCRILPPMPVLDGLSAAGTRTRVSRQVSIGYHATGIHQDEHQFLLPIIADVTRARPDVTVEIFADGKAARAWERLPQVRVRKPILWSDYLTESRQRQLDIMLAPLLASRVNDCRSPTKKIDVARLHAAGIYSRSPAYEAICDDDEILLENDADLWRRKIIDLIDDPQARETARAATRRVVERMAVDPTKLFEPLPKTG